MKHCIICNDKIVDKGRYHHSVCGAPCAKERTKIVRKASAEKRNKRYIKANPNYGSSRRWTLASSIWNADDHRNGRSWTKVFGERG